MAGALGGAQIATKQTQIGLENQPGFGSDPLTMHLSKMSKNQLIDIISELKVSTAQMIRMNYEVICIHDMPYSLMTGTSYGKQGTSTSTTTCDPIVA